MTIHQSLFSSRSEEWPTPQSFFDSLNAEFRFSLDSCATRENAKCRKFYTKDDDGLTQHWGNHRVFCNPPYGRTMLQWARKCFEASQLGATVVLLAHSRTDTRWFHLWVYGKAAEIRFVRGRLRFGDGTQSAPFPSMVAVFRPPTEKGILINSIAHAAKSNMETTHGHR
jgi:site-specific DNA-methyltransferase (adenine-specific)